MIELKILRFVCLDVSLNLIGPLNMFLYDDSLTLMSSSERTQDLLNILHGKGYRVVGDLRHVMIVNQTFSELFQTYTKGSSTLPPYRQKKKIYEYKSLFKCYVSHIIDLRVSTRTITDNSTIVDLNRFHFLYISRANLGYFLWDTSGKV